jgi:hypothetical protein
VIQLPIKGCGQLVFADLTPFDIYFLLAERQSIQKKYAGFARQSCSMWTSACSRAAMRFYDHKAKILSVLSEPASSFQSSLCFLIPRLQRPCLWNESQTCGGQSENKKQRSDFSLEKTLL